jgi:hypothetical protein
MLKIRDLGRLFVAFQGSYSTYYICSACYDSIPSPPWYRKRGRELDSARVRDIRSHPFMLRDGKKTTNMNTIFVSVSYYPSI